VSALDTEDRIRIQRLSLLQYSRHMTNMNMQIFAPSQKSSCHSVNIVSSNKTLTKKSK